MRSRRILCRGIAGFLGALSLVNAVAGIATTRLNANGWWLDLRPLPDAMALVVQLAGAAALLAIGLGIRLGPRGRTLVAGTVVVLALCVLRNAVQFYVLLWRGTIDAGFPVPLSLPLFAILIWIAKVSAGAPARVTSSAKRRESWGAAGVACAAMLVTPLLGIIFFGLADRVRTACDLYRQGLVAKLVFSGGPGDGPVHETQCMRRLARDAGVPDDAIFLDPDGVNTLATVRNTSTLFRSLGATRVLAVSHGYHLPRVKMCYQRHGLEVYTVPATQARTLRAMPFLVVREVAAAWAYYLRGE